MNELLPLKEAAEWATDYLGRPVIISNIQYLINYAKIKRCLFNNAVAINVNELRNYYEKNKRKQEQWKKFLGNDLDWALSFEHLREVDTTKHVHRLHPYKGKFIPQLVEYFLDGKINHHKKEIFFKQGDIVLDPFMGSGTTLVQASELGMHSIGIDVSEFNCLISNVKLQNYDFEELEGVLKDALSKIKNFTESTFNDAYKNELKEKLCEFNNKHFPNPEFKHKVYKGKIKEEKYSKEKLKLFIEENEDFLKSEIGDKKNLANDGETSVFLNKWFSQRIRQELFYYLRLIEEVKDQKIKSAMKIILSRTARSCRATTHSDLATLKEPQIGSYYCPKHKKICVPVSSIMKHLRRNTFDTINRLKEFSQLKKDVHAEILNGDSREIDILKELKKKNKEFYRLLNKKKIDGVFTSPPYVGQIDYHEQHAYSYELFNIKRRDKKEIGPLYKGKGKEAQESYVESIKEVLLNIQKFLKDDADLFIVANDKLNLYPKIAERSNLRIINQYKRPVLNRTERDKQPYSETIFHMKRL